MFAQAEISIPEDLDTKAAKDALLFYTNFINEDGVWNDLFPEANTAFANGQVSMIFAPSWRILDIIAQAPALDFGVAPVPQVYLDKPVCWGSFWMDVVSAKSSNSKAAWEFLNWLSAEEQQLFIFEEAAQYRGFGAPYSRVSLAEELELNDYLQPIVAGAPYAVSNDLAARAGNAKQVDALAEAVESVLAGENVDTAMKSAKAALSQ